MNGRHLLCGFAATLLCLMLFAGSASARTSHRSRHHKSAPAPLSETSTCLVKSLPTFRDQFGRLELGEGFRIGGSDVADVVEVECDPTDAGRSVTVSAQELFDRCKGNLLWSTTETFVEGALGNSFKGVLDDDGNATFVMWGSECAAGESLIAADVEAAPDVTVLTSFTVLPPAPTEPGVEALPSHEVEQGEVSSFATIIQVEFPPEFAEDRVSISARQLYARCRVEPHLIWAGPFEALPHFFSATYTVTLDDDGNAFVVLFGLQSCAPGTALIEASLEEAPYTTVTTEFTVEPPQPTI